MDEPVVVHVDDDVVVAVKPPGLLAVPGRGPAGADSLFARLQPRFPGLAVVHRLDMATSGLMVFARGAAATRALGVAFGQRRVDKRYVAVVEGGLDGDAGEIDMPLRADWPNRPRQVVDRAAGKPSRTRWHVLERMDDATRLELEPLTGRTHQLRVHLQSIGHPIRGDALYASAPLGAARLLLHAARLAFAHPSTQAPLVFTSPAPF